MEASSGSPKFGPKSSEQSQEKASTLYSAVSGSGRAKPRIPTPVPAKKPGTDFGNLFKQLKSGRKKSTEKPRGSIKALNPQMRSPYDKAPSNESLNNEGNKSGISSQVPHRAEKKARRQLPQVPPARAQSMDNLDSTANTNVMNPQNKQSGQYKSVRDAVKHFEEMTTDANLQNSSSACIPYETAIALPGMITSSYVRYQGLMIFRRYKIKFMTLVFTFYSAILSRVHNAFLSIFTTINSIRVLLLIAAQQ